MSHAEYALLSGLHICQNYSLLNECGAQCFALSISCKRVKASFKKEVGVALKSRRIRKYIGETFWRMRKEIGIKELHVGKSVVTPLARKNSLAIEEIIPWRLFRALGYASFLVARMENHLTPSTALQLYWVVAPPSSLPNKRHTVLLLTHRLTQNSGVFYHQCQERERRSNSRGTCISFINLRPKKHGGKPHL
ncbi:hypothetical protein TcCL_NonESM04058 [Trypanosoma cruzi]|nr:hypothetical protein TcCL_NonESM04058 [Trypanosoma cruzi]